MELIKSEQHANTRSGTNRARGTSARATDDHREKHAMECEKRFARSATKELRKLVAESGADHVVLCASSRMLGFLRNEFSVHRGIELHEVPRDMTKLAAAGIHAHLAKVGLLPALQKRNRTWRSCAQRVRPRATR
jgi:protein required for attachment to host cells